MNGQWKPTRRNRNVGTAKAGYGHNNRFSSSHFTRAFHTNVSISVQLDQRTIRFLIEPTNEGYTYCCTIEDIMHMLSLLHQQGTEFPDLFVLAQPKRKQEILRPAWGRIDFSINANGFTEPAIILHAIDLSKPICWSRSLRVPDSAELERLKADGHAISENKRSLVLQPSLDSVRSTQLYRTILHEIGHWVMWKRVLENEDRANQDKQLSDAYFRISSEQREAFANQYADKIRQELLLQKGIPFDRVSQ